MCKCYDQTKFRSHLFPRETWVLSPWGTWLFPKEKQCFNYSPRQLKFLLLGDMIVPWGKESLSCSLGQFKFPLLGDMIISWRKCNFPGSSLKAFLWGNICSKSFSNHSYLILYIYIYIGLWLSLERFQTKLQLCNRNHLNQNSHTKVMFTQSCSLGEHGYSMREHDCSLWKHLNQNPHAKVMFTQSFRHSCSSPWNLDRSHAYIKTLWDHYDY
jgi:hypothetical protein